MNVRDAIPDDARAIAKVHVDTWRTTYRGIVPDEVLEGLSYDRSEEGWRTAMEDRSRSNHLLVAEDEKGHVIGFAAAGALRDDVEGFDAEVYAIYVLEEHQNGGVGRQLMSQAAKLLQEEGFSSLMVWVLAGNPARRFYERLGAKQLVEKEIEIGGVSLPEIGYGWASLKALVRREGQ